jgi:hypothetical protein
MDHTHRLVGLDSCRPFRRHCFTNMHDRLWQARMLLAIAHRGKWSARWSVPGPFQHCERFLHQGRRDGLAIKDSSGKEALGFGHCCAALDENVEKQEGASWRSGRVVVRSNKSVLGPLIDRVGSIFPEWRSSKRQTERDRVQLGLYSFIFRKAAVGSVPGQVCKYVSLSPRPWSGNKPHGWVHTSGPLL